jgi:exodeoxyribonuclease III
VPFRLLTYNIRIGGVGRLEALARIINACAPDVVLLQEATRPSLIEQLASRTGMAEWRAFPRQSLGYMSRTPVVHASWHRPRLSHHAFVEVVPAGDPLRLFGVHLSAVHAAWTERRRVYELKALLRSVRQHQAGLHVLAGDFNTLAPGAPFDVRGLPLRLRPFVWMSGGRIKWRTVQTVLDAGYVDAFRLRHPADPGFTLPAGHAHVRLDYAFVPQTFSERIVRCDVVQHPDAPLASDHLPVVLDLDTSASRS